MSVKQFIDTKKNYHSDQQYLLDNSNMVITISDKGEIYVFGDQDHYEEDLLKQIEKIGNV